MKKRSLGNVKTDENIAMPAKHPKRLIFKTILVCISRFSRTIYRLLETKLQILEGKSPSPLTITMPVICFTTHDMEIIAA